LHETLHAVFLRLDGLDIADVVDKDDSAWTRLVEPQKYTVPALMAPEDIEALMHVFYVGVRAN
jgi:hypothetical protein